MAFKLDNIESKKAQRNKIDLDKLLKTEIRLGRSFSNKKKEAFYTELNVLLNAGINLKAALTLIHEEQKKRADKELF